jgi:flagellar biosynthesis GTPase FlhF
MTNKMVLKQYIAFLVVFALLAVPVLVSAQDVTPAVTVSDQESDGTSVTIANVAAAVPGWIVIHIDADGRPGPVLGQTAVEVGDNSDVVVELDPPLEEDTVLWAMLHVDEGEAGVYEFPGPDGPVRDGDMIVMTPFTAMVTVTEADAAAAEEAADEEAVTDETATEEAAAEEAVAEEATEEAATEEAVAEEATEEAAAEEAATEEAAAEEAVEAAAVDEEAAAEEAVEAAAVDEEAAAEEAVESEATAEEVYEAPAAPEMLPVTGAGFGGAAAQAVPAALAALSALAGSLWANRRRRS